MMREHRLSPSIAVTGALLALLSMDVLAGADHAKTIAAALLAVVAVIWVERLARSWTALIATLLLVTLLIPNNGSYTLPQAVPFQLEPYRVIVALLLIAWVVSLLIDRRVKASATGFEGPLIAIAAVTLASEFANPARVGSLSSFVIKALWLLACFILAIYVIASVVHTRAAIERIIVALVAAGTFVAMGALLQRRTGYNVFDHLHYLIPMFDYNGTTTAIEETRFGALRAFGSSGIPIELGAVMAMLVPFAIYLAITRSRLWWGAVALMLFGDLTASSRTGVVGLLVMLVVFLWLRPRQTLRCWPALIPFLAILHIAAPGAIGSVIGGFFPKGGIVKQQEETFIGPGGKVEYGSRLSRLGPELHEFSEHNPLLGIGYGTRITGRLSGATDNAIILDDQWLDTLLETGLLGVLAWLWLFSRALRRLSRRAKRERDFRDGWLLVAFTASTATFASAMFLYDAFSFVQGMVIALATLALGGVLLRLLTQSSPETDLVHPATDLVGAPA